MNKSAVIKCLEKDIQHEQPPYVNVQIIEGFFLLHTEKNDPKDLVAFKKNVANGYSITSVKS